MWRPTMTNVSAQMTTDTAGRRRGRRVAAIVIAITLLIGAIPFTVPVIDTWSMKSQVNEIRQMLCDETDPLPLRDAGRHLLSLLLKESQVTVSDLPPLLQKLHPTSVYVEDQHWLQLEFGGGLHHLGLLIAATSYSNVPEDDPGYSHKQLADGIWYYEQTN
jgi:hypothetical protein